MSDYTVNEKTSAMITLWFQDENNKNVVPSQVIWRLDDARILELSGAQQAVIIDDTIETPSFYKHTIYVPASANSIIDESNIWEEKILTVRYVYGGGVKDGTEEIRYRVINLVKIS